jgi:LacI family gluconate utilization system Gnt-I transcriptional repressor
MAAGAILQAPSVGLRLPEDCAIAGFGDAPLAAHLHPALTTMRPDRHAIGRIAAELLVELLAASPDTAPAEPRRIVVPCTVVVRVSAQLTPAS